MGGLTPLPNIGNPLQLLIPTLPNQPGSFQMGLLPGQTVPAGPPGFNPGLIAGAFMGDPFAANPLTTTFLINNAGGGPPNIASFLGVTPFTNTLLNSAFNPLVGLGAGAAAAPAGAGINTGQQQLQQQQLLQLLQPPQQSLAGLSAASPFGGGIPGFGANPFGGIGQLGLGASPFGIPGLATPQGSNPLLGGMFRRVTA